MHRLLYAGLNDEALRVAPLLDRRRPPHRRGMGRGQSGPGQRRDLARRRACLAARRCRLSVCAASPICAHRQYQRRGGASPVRTARPGCADRPRRMVGAEAHGRPFARVRDPAAAYEVLTGHSAQDRLEISEIEFEAGWVALRLLDDPAAAIPHFERIAQSSSLPLSQSRAAYWLGRSHELAGATDAAEASYRLAAGFPTTFYGQLALARLGETMLPIAASPGCRRGRRGGLPHRRPGQGDGLARPV